jgi:NDP-sugar pyrophosphorylase family protein
LLDTGGGIKNVEVFLENPHLLTINADSFFDPQFSFTKFVEEAKSNPCAPLATLLLKEHPEAALFGEFGIDASGRITSYLGELNGGEVVKSGLLYTGVQLISRKLFPLMPPAGTIFSITQHTYRDQFRKRMPLWSSLHEGYWNDLGTPARLADAVSHLDE